MDKSPLNTTADLSSVLEPLPPQEPVAIGTNLPVPTQLPQTPRGRAELPGRRWAAAWAVGDPRAEGRRECFSPLPHVYAQGFI